MSAFVVDDKTINRLVAFLMYEKPHYGDEWKRMVAEHGFDLYDMEQARLFAEELHAMNVAAVCQRYADDSPEMYPFKFQLVLTGRISAAQAVKSLHCLHYQCCEGDVPDTWPAYKLLEALANAICYEIVSESPEYEMAEWG